MIAMLKRLGELRFADSGTEIRFDESRPAITNLLTIYQLMTGKSVEETEAHFAGKGYAQLKTGLADLTVEFLKPVQERLRSIADEELDRILEEGRKRAQKIARATLNEVKMRRGIVGTRG